MIVLPQVLGSTKSKFSVLSVGGRQALNVKLSRGAPTRKLNRCQQVYAMDTY